MTTSSQSKLGRMMILGLCLTAMIVTPGSSNGQRPTGQYQLMPQAITQDFGGGSGGRNVTNAQCDQGFLAIGFHFRIGEYFNEAWLDCAPLRPDGTLGREVRTTARTGAPGGSAYRDAQCTNGRVLRGLQGRAAASVDQIVGVCSLPHDIGNRIQRPRHHLTASVTIPRPGGRPAQASCPIGSAVVGFQTKSASWIDHLWIMCSEIRSNQPGGGAVQPVRPQIPGATWKGDPVATCIKAVRARMHQDYGRRVAISLPPAQAQVGSVSVGDLMIPVSGPGQFTPLNQPAFRTRYQCQIDKRFGSVNSVDYTRPNVQPQPR